VKEMLQYMLISPPGGVRFDTSVLGSDGSPTPAFGALVKWVHSNTKNGRVEPNPGKVDLPSARRG